MFASPDPHRPEHSDPWAYDHSDNERLDFEAPLTPADHQGMLDDLGLLLDDAPLRFLDFACSATMPCALDRALFISNVEPRWPRELRALGVAAQWLGNDPVIRVMGTDLPAWLAELGETDVTAMRRHRDQQTGATTYLLELRMVGDELGCIEIRLGPDGAITHAFPIDLPLERVEEIATVATSGKPPRYRTINAATAHRELVVAFGLFHAAPAFDTDPSNTWPETSPLVALVLRCLAQAADGGQRTGAP